MEYFFYGDRFCRRLNDLITYCLEEKVEDLPEDWQAKVEHSVLEPVFNIDAEGLSELLFDCFGDRLSENFSEQEEEEILEALRESIDFDKLKSLLPQYYYPNGQFSIITKSDLLEKV